MCLVAKSGYEIVDGVIRRPPVPNGTPVSLTIYHPLRDAPDLFLRFAKLHVSRDQEDAVLTNDVEAVVCLQATVGSVPTS